MEAKIRDALDTYREQIDAAVSVIKTSMLTEFDDLHIPKFEAKTVGSNVPAREQTMVDASLQMADAMRHALCLKFPPRVSKLDVVLKATVQAVASAGGNIVEMRKLRRQKLRVASNMVSDLNRELQALVPEFARPIAGHVNFALVEVLVRAVGWRHSTLVHNLISGFEPIGTVPSTECLRPVDEPEPGAMSKESNAQSFDDAIKHLSRKARTRTSRHWRTSGLFGRRLWPSVPRVSAWGLCHAARSSPCLRTRNLDPDASLLLGFGRRGSYAG